MGLFSGIGDIFSGATNIVKDTLGGIDDLAHLDFGGVGDRLGNIGGELGDGVQGLGNWAEDIGRFELNQVGNWWDKFKNNPLQLALGGATPLTAKVWNKVLGTDWTPYVTNLGGATEETFRDAESKGINTGAARGAGRVADTVASYYGGQALGGLLGSAGGAASSAGGAAELAGTMGGTAASGAGAGYTAGSGLAGMLGNAGAKAAVNGGIAGLDSWSNGGSFSKPFLSGSAGSYLGAAGNQGASSLTDLFGSGADYFKKANDYTNGALGNTLMGAAKGGLASMAQGNGFTQGATQGGLTSGIGSGINQALNMTGMTQPQQQIPGQVQQPQPNYGNAIAGGLLGLYNAQQAKNDLNGQIGQLNQLFSPNSAYAQQLEQQLARKDAAAGRRSQYGPRSVELQARLAEMASRQAPVLNQLYQQKDQARLSQYKDLYHVLSKTGLLDKLGSVGQNYFNSMMGTQPMGNYNQGQFMGPINLEEV